MNKILVLGLIASVAHEINRAYCASLGDQSQPAWADAPDWQKESAQMGVNMHLANPDATPEQSHASWLEKKLADGWVYGEVKDAEAKTHPCCLPYEQLPAAQKAKDYIFRATVHAMKGVSDAVESEIAGLLGELDALKSELASIKAGAPASAPAVAVSPGLVGVCYVGRRATFDDHLYGTGLSFTRDQVRALPAEVAVKFLRHSDVFRKVEVSADAPADPDTMEKLEGASKAAQEQIEKENAVLDLRDSFRSMTKAALIDYAKVHYRVDLDSKAKVDDLRRQLTSLVDRFGVA